MAATWGHYVTIGFLLLQTVVIFNLYLGQLDLGHRLDAYNVKEEDVSFVHRVRRNASSRSAASGPTHNSLVSAEIAVELSSEAPEPEPEPTQAHPVRRKHHKKTHSRVDKDKEKQVISSMESTTTSTSSPSMMVRSSRTKTTNLQVHQHQYQPQSHSIQANRQELAQYESPVSIHYVSDASNYTQARNPHYAGNGRLRVKGCYTDWSPAPWVSKLGRIENFEMKNGRVKIRAAGLYLVYAQIHYANVNEVNCFRVLKNEEVISQCCVTTTHPNPREIKANTCSLTTTVYIEQNDVIHLSDVHERYVILTAEKSFFGLSQIHP